MSTQQTTDYTGVEDQDRGAFADRKPPKSPGQKAVVALIALFALGILAYGGLRTAGLFAAKQTPVSQAEELKRPEQTPGFSVSLAEPVPPEPQFIECADGLKLPLGMTCPVANQPITPQPQEEPQAQPQPQGPTEEEILQKRRWESDIDVGANTAGSGRAAGAATGSGGIGGSSSGSRLSGNTALGGALLSTATARTVATVNRNPSFTLAKGTLPDCTLITAISTDQPGFLKCILSRPVYSMDGRVVLMEAGTTFEGEYQAGMARGKKRMFAVWSRAITPNHVEVALNSPSTDSLGRSGMSGQIDNHFWERFGGAMLYSLFSDYTDYLIKRSDQRSQERQAVISATGNGDRTTTNISMGARDFDQTRSTTDRIVESILNQGEDIQPTLHKNQGEIIKIYVARDVDFSQVYELSRNSRE